MLAGLTALFLGIRHAFDPDHIAAVLQFVSARPKPRQGAVLGIRWAVGHGTTVVLFVALTTLFRYEPPPGFERFAEITVGVTLILLAAWRLRRFLSVEHAHPHRHATFEHEHPHVHRPWTGHLHVHAPTLMGIVHGLAGLVGVLAILQLLFAFSAGARIFGAVLFSTGALLGMGVFGGLAGKLYGNATAERRDRIMSGLVLGTSALGALVGTVWIVVALR